MQCEDNDVNICDENAQCQFNDAEKKFTCACKDGYTGNGKVTKHIKFFETAQYTLWLPWLVWSMKQL